VYGAELKKAAYPADMDFANDWSFSGLEKEL